MHHMIRITCSAVHRVVLPSTILAVTHALSGAPMIIATHGVSVYHYMAVVPVNTAKKEKRRKANARRPKYIAMMVVVNVMTPAHG